MSNRKQLRSVQDDGAAADALGSSLAEEAARIQKIAHSIFPYMEHLQREALTNHRLDVADVLTLVSLCRQAYSPHTMHEDVRGILPTIAELLVRRIHLTREREQVHKALADLSPHISWLQPMVKYGFAYKDVSGPNQFLTYESFEKACRAIVSGQWEVDPEQMHHMAGVNRGFLDELETFERYIHARFCELYQDALQARSQS